jgi:hypothetical protein
MVAGNIHAHDKGIDGFAAVFSADNRGVYSSPTTSLKGVTEFLSRVVGRTLTTDEVKTGHGFRVEISEEALLKLFPQ